MDEVYILNERLELIAIIDTWESMIWASRYYDVGDCELYVPATAENLRLLKKGYYIARNFDDMVCRIVSVELDTDAENGNHIIVTGKDSKYFLDARIIMGTAVCAGNVELFLRDLVDKALIHTMEERKIDLFRLGEVSGLQYTMQRQISHENIGEKTREICKEFGLGYMVTAYDKHLVYTVYKGDDRSDSVIFSDDFENLLTTKYKTDDSDSLSYAMIGGDGEGSARTMTCSGGGAGVNRREVFVDARDVSRNVAYETLQAQFPTGVLSGTTFSVQNLRVMVIDEDHRQWILQKYPDARFETGNTIAVIPNAVVAKLAIENPNPTDTAVLEDVVYIPSLKGRGYETLAEHGETVTFEGDIEPNSTFQYKKDFFLGDIVRVANSIGIVADARIVEIIEVFDRNGYKMQPKFQYIV